MTETHSCDFWFGICNTCGQTPPPPAVTERREAMKPCPHCGVSLLESLVDSITDPHQEESCPKRPKAPVVALADRYKTEGARVIAISAFGFDIPPDAA